MKWIALQKFGENDEWETTDKVLHILDDGSMEIEGYANPAEDLRPLYNPELERRVSLSEGEPYLDTLLGGYGSSYLTRWVKVLDENKGDESDTTARVTDAIPSIPKTENPESSRRLNSESKAISVSISTAKDLGACIARLSPDCPVTDALSRGLWPSSEGQKREVWYMTQKEHWLGWLRGYEGTGAYGRKNWNRDAKFIYNHIVNPVMLFWLGEGAGLPAEKLKDASLAALKANKNLPSQVAAIRRHIPWGVVEKALISKAKL